MRQRLTRYRDWPWALRVAAAPFAMALGLGMAIGAGLFMLAIGVFVISPLILLAIWGPDWSFGAFVVKWVLIIGCFGIIGLALFEALVTRLGYHR